MSLKRLPMSMRDHSALCMWGRPAPRVSHAGCSKPPSDSGKCVLVQFRNSKHVYVHFKATLHRGNDTETPNSF